MGGFKEGCTMIETGLSDTSADNTDRWTGMGFSSLYYSVFMDHKSHGGRER